MKKREIFKIEGDDIKRERKHCPKCGPGVFLAEHKDRTSCGKCGYTEFKGKSRKSEKQVQEKPQSNEDKTKKVEEPSEEPKEEVKQQETTEKNPEENKQ